MQTTDARHEYLVDISEKARCTCYELQEMIWLCQHVMAWDDRDGRDFMRHFHPCWLTSSIVTLYAPRMPVFLSNDLQGTVDCCPPEFAVRKGRHRVVRMERGTRSGRRLPLAEDKFEDEDGNCFCTYPLQDDP